MTTPASREFFHSKKPPERLCERLSGLVGRLVRGDRGEEFFDRISAVEVIDELTCDQLGGLAPFDLTEIHICDGGNLSDALIPVLQSSFTCDGDNAFTHSNGFLGLESGHDHVPMFLAEETIQRRSFASMGSSYKKPP